MSNVRPTDRPGDPRAPRFEEALAELERIARDLEDGELGLEEALVRYESGVKLLRQCHELLAVAERRIELLAGVDADGNPITRPFEVAENGVSEAAAAQGKPPETVSETRPKNAPRRAEERPAARPKRPTRPGEIDESRELF
jgi:exodeoxyribonuclease VII small subunit